MNAAASHSTIYKAVLNGSMKSILDEVKAGLAQGMEPGMIVSDELIPAINEVGDLFEQQKYFLPQLIASAETMKKAIEYLEPMLSSGDETGPKVTIVIATVEGDILDIGKNLVALMLKNHGFHVIDLGKDVVEEGFAWGYVPHARAGKLREHVVRIVGKGVRFLGHEAAACVRAGDVEGDVHAVRFEDSLDFGVRACACDAYVGHRGGEVRLRL